MFQTGGGESQSHTHTHVKFTWSGPAEVPKYGGGEVNCDRRFCFCHFTPGYMTQTPSITTDSPPSHFSQISKSYIIFDFLMMMPTGGLTWVVKNRRNIILPKMWHPWHAWVRNFVIEGCDLSASWLMSQLY